MAGWLMLLAGFVTGQSAEPLLGDLDRNSLVNVFDLTRLQMHLAGNGPLPAEALLIADVNQDGLVSELDVDGIADLILGIRPAQGLPPPRIISSSPQAGESGVALTRETTIRFSQPLASTNVFNTNAIYAEFGGRRILSRVEPANDLRALTLFYNEPLPASARLRVSIDGSRLIGQSGVAVDGDGNGLAGGIGRVEFDTAGVTALVGTAIIGTVYASELVPGPGGLTNSVNVPLQGVTITVDGAEETLRTTTDAQGKFSLTPCPAGRFFVHVDGRTVVNLGAGIHYPDQSYYPVVGKAWDALAGVATNLAGGNGLIYLPLIRKGTLQPVSSVTNTLVSFPSSVIASNPALAGVLLQVPAGSLFSDSGTRGGSVGIAPVPSDRLPEPLPPGLDLPLVITVQTDGPSNFGQPVPVCFPNLPDPTTGKTLAPGAKSALWSFNHDTGRWEIVGPMTVSDDGTTVCTDPGVGILQPGWHGVQQGTQGGGAEPDPDIAGREPPNIPEGCDPLSACPCDEKQPEGVGGSNPVVPQTGEKVEQVVDLRIRGVGMDFVWSRTYSSISGPDTAQGNGWDFGYNLSMRPSGMGVRYVDGRTRDDLLMPVLGKSNTWARLGTFRETSLDASGRYVITTADNRKALFHPFDGSPAGGKIASIVDRNGNALRFAYDPKGRLKTVTDTLDRDIQLIYNDEGFIESVTDFTGRSVRYAYYREGESGGNLGDLKSVTSPAVTGTPNGNDFPNGKTTTYTYSTGFSDDRLNHNLLTITDGRRNDPNDSTFGGGPYLVNVYATTTDPEHVEYDRVLRQARGGDLIQFAYTRLTPASANAGASLLVTVSDRSYARSEHFYDAGGRRVMLREHNGRRPSNAGTNSLGWIKVSADGLPKIRGTDPDYFETRWDYTPDFKPSRTIHPNGNITEFIYEPEIGRHPALFSVGGQIFNPPPPRTRGNLRAIRRLPGTHQPAGDQTELVELFEYDTSFGCSSCGFNFVTQHTDARGNVTLSHYDPRGNLLARTNPIASSVENFTWNERGQLTSRLHPDNGSGHRRLDTNIYYLTGPQRGYLAATIVDAGGFHLTTRYEYDLVGNVTKVTDPRGHDTQFVFNHLDQVVRQISPEVLDGSAIRYTTDLFYDANNNLVRREVVNRRELLLEGVRPFASAVGTSIGFGPADGGLVSTNPAWSTTYQYDILNHPTRILEEVEPDRFIVTEFGYDQRHNRTLVRSGEATAGRQTNSVIRTLFDERNLPFRITRGAGGTNQSTTQLDYDPNANLVASHDGLEESPRSSRFVYDAFDRRVSTTDAMGNVTTNSFDPNGNLTRTVVLGELDDVAGSAANVRLSETVSVFDAMDRITRRDVAFFNSTNQLAIGDGLSNTVMVYSDTSQIVAVTNDNGHATLTAYDTANRPRVTTDAKGNQLVLDYDANNNVTRRTSVEKADLGTPDESFVTSTTFDNLNRAIATVDGSGNLNRIAYDSRGNPTLTVDALTNVVRTTFDGLSRPLDTIREMVDRVGVPPLKPTIITRQVWDDSSRLVAQIDDNGNPTTYLHDALNRRFATVHADGTGMTNRLDVHGNSLLFTDANGNWVTNRYDDLDRLTRRDVRPGPTVATNTTWEDYRYDGLSRLNYAANDNSLVVRVHDSLGNLLREQQGTQSIAYVHDGVGNKTEIRYPGGQIVTTGFDALERKKTIADTGGPIATFHYVGPNRVARRENGNGTRADFSYDGLEDVPNAANDNGFMRLTRTRHYRVADNAAIDDRTYTWDRTGNKTLHQDAAVQRAYAYDSAYRLVRSTRSDTGSITYGLDGAQNRRSVTGGPDAGTYTLDSTTPEPADAQLNQYTATPFGTQQHDRNGNLAAVHQAAQSRTLAYDYRNRLVQVATVGTNAAFAYDVFNRRVTSTVGGANTKFFYDGWQTVEEQDGAGSTSATYVFGLYLDEPLQMRRGAAVHFYHADDLYNVRKLTTASGLAVESYDYTDFGQLTQQSDVVNPYLFSGHRFDSFSGIYYAKNRHFDPRVGQFLSRDPMGTWSDQRNFGNSKVFGGNTPTVTLDPSGLMSISGSTAGQVWNGVTSLIGAAVADVYLANTGTSGDYEYLNTIGDLVFGRPSVDQTQNSSRDTLNPHEYVTKNRLGRTCLSQEKLTKLFRDRFLENFPTGSIPFFGESGHGVMGLGGHGTLEVGQRLGLNRFNHVKVAEINDAEGYFIVETEAIHAFGGSVKHQISVIDGEVTMTQTGRGTDDFYGHYLKDNRMYRSINYAAASRMWRSLGDNFARDIQKANVECGCPD